MPESFIPTPLILSEMAIAKILEIKQQEENSSCFLRLFVEGGGCAGFQYGFKLDDCTTDDDIKIESKGAKLIVDSTSLPLVAGATVDYEVGLMGSKFVLKNLNASSTCSCGISFSV